MIKVVSFKICPFVQRVTALLEAKAQPYDIEYIDLSNKPSWFLRASPNGQVPILITDDDQVLFESDAIVEYIDEVIGAPLWSSDPVARAQERAWSFLATKHYLAQCSLQRSTDEKTFAGRADKFLSAFAKIESQLGEGRFGPGRGVGMVDIAWLPLLHRAAIVEQLAGYDLLASFPQSKRWQQALMASGLPEKSVSTDFVERFSAFYFPPSTYLGQLAMQRSGVPCGGQAQCTVKDMACCS